MLSDLSIDGIRRLDKYGVKCTVAKTLRVQRLSHFQCYVQLGTPSRYRSANDDAQGHRHCFAVKL